MSVENRLVEIEKAAAVQLEKESAQNEKLKDIKESITNLLDENVLRDKGYSTMEQKVKSLEAQMKNTVDEKWVTEQISYLNATNKASIVNVKEIYDLKLSQSAKSFKQWLAFATFVVGVLSLIVGKWIG